MFPADGMEWNKAEKQYLLHEQYLLHTSSICNLLPSELTSILEFKVCIISI